MLRGAGLIVALVLVVSAGAAAPGHAASTDSEAPPNAPPHWLPPEPWVYNHWLPYDEERLHRLLRIDRGDVWRALRDDTHALAELAARRGWPDASALAEALVAPWRSRVSRAQYGLLRSRAERTLTQGHLAQHVFFHSLHQFAIPSAAPDLFGVSDARFRALRRAELSPLQIAALHGRPAARVQAAAIEVLRERAQAGVDERQTPAAQARRLLARQVAQLPRWLGQARYNGPPKTRRGKLVVQPRDYARNPVVTADGGAVLYEHYRQALPQALALGEIAVVRADRALGTRTVVSRPSRVTADGTPQPISAYNPSVSADGTRVVYEVAAGNRNFAKRYGRIQAFVDFGATGAARPLADVSRPGGPSRSAYNPVVAADGRVAIFQAVAGDRTGVFREDLRTGAVTAVSDGPPPAPGRYREVFEPEVSADGGIVAYTELTGSIGRVAGASSRVVVRDLVRGSTVAVGDGFASDPALSPEGRFLAYTTLAPGGVPALRLRDLRTGADTAVPGAGADAALDPQVARGARVVAFTAVRDGVSRVLAWDRARGTTTLVSRASGAFGAPARGSAGDAAIAADAATVAFVSDAPNLDPGARTGAPAVYVRDLRTHATRLVSAPAFGPGPAIPAAAALAPPLAAGARGDQVSVTDNAFVSGGRARPVVRVRAGEAVTWTWRSKESHNVTVAGRSSATTTGGRHARTFQRPGSYAVVCTLHAPGMRMRVEVG